MRIFITGATGFIGRALTLRLARDGHKLVAWTRSPDRAGLGADVELCDASAGEAALREQIEAADAVVNLAGEPVVGRWSRRKRERLRTSRVDLTGAIVRAIQTAERRPRVFISASAIGIYGDRCDERLDEDSELGTGFLADLCRDWEQAAAVADGPATRVAQLRFGIVLGRGGALAKMLPVFRLGLGGPVGSGNQFVSWIHVDDAVELIAVALTDPRYRGPINAVAPLPVTNRELSESVAAAVGSRARFGAPAAAVKLMLGKASSVLLASQRVYSRRLAALGFRYRFSRIDDAVRDAVSSGRVAIGRATNPPTSDYLRRRKPRYAMVQRTIIDAPLDEVFDFFSQAENLAALTPPKLSFQILTPTPVEMRPGAEIDYRIGLGPIPMKWKTVIEDWEPGVRFVDAQHRGPYRCWWHEHRFAADGNRTIMEDVVHYAPPLGILGRIAHRLFIARTLREIFSYRTGAIRLRFGAPAIAHLRAA